MDERDRHRAFPDCGCDALDRAVPDVAGDEDAGFARLEEHRISLQRPPAATPAVLEEVRARHQKAALVPPQPSLDAGGERLAADQDEEGIRGKLTFLLPGVVHDDPRLEPVAPHDDNLAVTVEGRLARRRSVEDAGPDQPLHPVGLEPAVVDTSRNDAGPGFESRTVRELDPRYGVVERLLVGTEVRPVGTEPPAFGGHVLELGTDEDLRAQPYRLLIRALGELGPADPLGESRIVLDPRARPRLASRRERLEDDDAKALRRRIERGC